MERVIVTCPGSLLDEVDGQARRLGKKRSQVVREALAEWLTSQREREFEALLEEGYREYAEREGEIDPDWVAVQAEAAAATWRWDD
ncbi:MAG: hypothetical protein HW416_3511 [Chloroflexi bacterium]|nr:hypothetical protein [Chloroflexota bacterium]